MELPLLFAGARGSLRSACGRCRRSWSASWSAVLGGTAALGPGGWRAGRRSPALLVVVVGCWRAHALTVGLGDHRTLRFRHGKEREVTLR